MYKTEKVWIRDRNICCVIMTDMGHRCGYVGIAPEHPLYGHGYNDKPEILQDSRKTLEQTEIGKRGPIEVLMFCYEDGVRISSFFDVHGSITYSGGNYGYPTKVSTWRTWPCRSGASFFYTPWWFGYDCAHVDDGKDLSVLSDKLREIEEMYPTHGILRTLDYCIGECNYLSDQLERLYDLPNN